MTKNSIAFVLTRAKEPVLPLPTSAAEMWSSLTPFREEIVSAMHAVRFCYWFDEKRAICSHILNGSVLWQDQCHLGGS